MNVCSTFRVFNPQVMTNVWHVLMVCRQKYNLQITLPFVKYTFQFLVIINVFGRRCVQWICIFWMWIVCNWVMWICICDVIFGGLIRWISFLVDVRLIIYTQHIERCAWVGYMCVTLFWYPWNWFFFLQEEGLAVSFRDSMGCMAHTVHYP